jgi:hypothetical protein
MEGNQESRIQTMILNQQINNSLNNPVAISKRIRYNY